jgi:hypothetical protein
MDKVYYLKFNGNDFTNFILFVKSMNTRDKVKGSRIATLSVEDSKLVCRAVDDVSNIIEYNVELYDTSDQINEVIAAPVTDLYALIKSTDNDKFTIRKSYNQYEFNVIGNGWIPFRSVDVDINKYKVDGIQTELGTINSVKLRNAISSVLGYTQEYTYARDKYIQFSKTQMVVTSRLSSVIMSDDFVEMTLHRDDASMLRLLLKDNFDLRICKIESSIAEKLLFVGPNFKFTVIAAGIDSNNLEYNNNLNNYLSINGDELFKLTMFSEEYSASKHIIGMSIKNGKLNVSIKNVLAAKHSSIVKSTPVGDVQDTSSEAEVSSHNLLKALKLFQDKRSRDINIYISDEMLSNQNSIILFDSNTQAIINIYNR